MKLGLCVRLSLGTGVRTESSAKVGLCVRLIEVGVASLAALGVRVCVRFCLGLEIDVDSFAVLGLGLEIGMESSVIEGLCVRLCLEVGVGVESSVSFGRCFCLDNISFGESVGNSVGVLEII